MAQSLADRQGAATRKYIRGKKGRNKPPKDEPWIWMTHALMESPAWRSLSPNGRKVMDRVLIEHMSHAGSENGNLIVTHLDFEDYGVTRRLITQAINEAEYLGLAKGEPRSKSQIGGPRSNGRKKRAEHGGRSQRPRFA